MARLLYFGIFLLLMQCPCTFAYAGSCKDASRVPFSSSDFPVVYPESVEKDAPLLQSLRDADVLEHASQTCGQAPAYLNSMERLEEAIAETAAQSESVLEAARKVNANLFEWITLIAEIQAITKISTTKRETDNILKKIFGDCNGQDPGCVGNKPENIRAAFKEGNLREQFYLSWNPAINFINNYFYCDDPNATCFCKLDGNSGMGQFVKKHLENKSLHSMVKVCEEILSGGSPLQRGRFAAANKFFREEIPENNGTPQFVLNGVLHDSPSGLVNTPPIGAVNGSPSVFLNSSPSRLRKHSGLVVPLSEREKRVPDAGPAIWNKGFNNFQSVPIERLNSTHAEFPDVDHLYYKTAHRFGFSTPVAMSGSTDSILNLACLFGLENEHSSLLLGAMGYMVSHLHHSSYEIMVGGRSFEGLKNIPLNSDYYRHLSSEPDFASKVEQKYAATGDSEMPSQIYHECLKKFIKSAKNLSASLETCHVSPVYPAQVEYRNKKSFFEKLKKLWK